jgi:hypothetical protein
MKASIIIISNNHNENNGERKRKCENNPAMAKRETKA